MWTWAGTLAWGCVAPLPEAAQPAAPASGAPASPAPGDAAILSGDVKSVDGQPLPGGEPEFRLSPGCHRVGMKEDFAVNESGFSVHGYMEPVDVDLLMKPKHHYSLRYRMSDGAAGMSRIAILAYETDPATNAQRRLPVTKARPGTQPCSNPQ